MSTWRVEFVGDSGSEVTLRSRFNVDRTRQLNPPTQPADVEWPSVAAMAMKMGPRPP